MANEQSANGISQVDLINLFCDWLISNDYSIACGVNFSSHVPDPWVDFCNSKDLGDIPRPDPIGKQLSLAWNYPIDMWEVPEDFVKRLR